MGGRIVFRLLFVFLTFECVTCSKPHEGCIFPENCKLQAGDVVLRCGSGMLSHAVLLADQKGGVYSHVGIVADSAGTLMIVHAVPDEPDFEGDPDRVKMESPSRFFHAMRANHGAVLRHHDAEVARKAADVAVAAYRRHALFDHEYDDADSTRLYCTELVVFSFARAGAPLSGVEHHKLPLPGLDYECILPSDIQNCSDFELVISF